MHKPGGIARKFFFWTHATTKFSVVAKLGEGNILQGAAARSLTFAAGPHGAAIFLPHCVLMPLTHLHAF